MISTLLNFWDKLTDPIGYALTDVEIWKIAESDGPGEEKPRRFVAQLCEAPIEGHQRTTYWLRYGKLTLGFLVRDIIDGQEYYYAHQASYYADPHEHVKGDLDDVVEAFPKWKEIIDAEVKYSIDYTKTREELYLSTQGFSPCPHVLELFQKDRQDALYCGLDFGKWLVCCEDCRQANTRSWGTTVWTQLSPTEADRKMFRYLDI